MGSNYTATILAKWSNRNNYFIRHKDNNTQNNKINNLEYVSVKDAMENFDTWTTDWMDGLTKIERKIVSLKNWREGLIFGE